MLNLFKNKLLSYFLGKDIEEQLKNAKNDAEKVKILMELIGKRAEEMAELSEENKNLKEEVKKLLELKEQAEKELKEYQAKNQAEDEEIYNSLVEVHKKIDRINEFKKSR